MPRKKPIKMLRLIKSLISSTLSDYAKARHTGPDTHRAHERASSAMDGKLKPIHATWLQGFSTYLLIVMAIEPVQTNKE
jgi:hypothetical protein